MSNIIWTIPFRPSAKSLLLLQDSFFLLLEDSGRIIIQEMGWTNRTAITSSFTHSSI